jgi:hypothetical protein
VKAVLRKENRKFSLFRIRGLGFCIVCDIVLVDFSKIRGSDVAFRTK